MKLWIEPDALGSDGDYPLPQTLLFGLKYLQKHGYDLSWDAEGLNNEQRRLLSLEKIEPASFESGDADGIITHKNKGEFRLLADSKTLATGTTWEELAVNILFPRRTSSIKRKTKETDISLELNLDGTGNSRIKTGLNFFDHMLDQIAKHGLVDLNLTCNGDLEVDEHHTIEDSAIAIGQAIREAVTDNKAGIQRYGFFLVMDEAQATVGIDLSDRPYLRWEVELQREYVGDFPTEMLEHFFYTLAMNAKATLHVKADGKNEHHIIEAVFKSFAKALRFAVSRNERIKGILPSTKGII